MFFINSFLLALEKRQYFSNDKNVKNVFVLTDNGNMLNPLEYMKKNVFDSEENKQENLKPKMEVFISNPEVTNGNNGPIDCEQQYQEGLKHFNEGNYKQALEIFSDLLPLYPSKRNIIFYLNKSQDIILQNAENVKYKNLKDIMNYNLKSARNCARNKEYIKAYDFYEKIILLNNSQKKLYEEVLDIDKIMENILEKRENFNIEEYHYAKSYFLFKDAKMDKCIDEWEKILELNPNRTEIKDFVILFKKKSYKNKFDARKISLFLNEGIRLYNNQKYEKALNNFYKILLISDDEIAKLYLKECKIKIEQKAKKQDVVYIDVLKNVEIKENKDDEKKYKHTIRDIFDSKKSLQTLAIAIKSEKDNKNKNLKNEDEILKIIDILYQKGLDCYYSGDIENARMNWQKILEYEPKNKRALQRLKKLQKMKNM